MGREARANTRTRDGKPRTESGARQRDWLRTTVPDFTRRSLVKYLGIEDVVEIRKREAKRIRLKRKEEQQ